MLTKSNKIRACAEQTGRLFHLSPDMMCIMDFDGQVQQLNPAWERTLGHTIEELTAALWSSLHPDDREETLAEIARLQANATGALEFQNRFLCKDGSYRWLAWNAVADPQARMIYAVAHDVTANKTVEEALWLSEERIAAQVEQLKEYSVRLEAQQQELRKANGQLAQSNGQLAEANCRLEALTTTDGLTGLKNHRAFQERLTQECHRCVRYGSSLSLVLIDIDRFKQYNDAFGHPAGDDVLRRIASMLQEQVRLTDLVARYGGEEFAVLLPATGAEGAQLTAERLRAAIETFSWERRPITISLGFSTWRPSYETPADFVMSADRALYRSKRSGRNRITAADEISQNYDPQPITLPLYSDMLEEMLKIQVDSLSIASDQLRETLADAYDATIRSWSHLLDMRDQETEGHSLRVTDLTVRLATRIGMNFEEVLYARWGALLHDVGKMGVPDSILHKAGPLTDEEWTIMRRHTIIANEMLFPVAFLRPALDIPYCHHEKWDGTGYPNGLKGEEIPLAARLFAPIDVYDALTSNRPYRSAWSRERTLAHLQSLAGTHFDPRAVDMFVAMMSEADGETLESAVLPQAA